jgi:peptidoglycan/xylan/chitin deacetylase (PgdA/CDA1 family)
MMFGSREGVKRIARYGFDRVARNRTLERAACWSAAALGRGIALLWHRIRDQGPTATEPVRAVSTAAFVEQLDILLELGDVVSLVELESARRRRRPSFALTFDDDDPGHTETTLPILVARGLPATFFLSGRWRDQHGPYWWEVLEARIRTEGIESIASAYGLPESADAEEIARSIVGTVHASELAEAAHKTTWRTMEAHQARALAAAGMEIGFHTLHHPSLPGLDSAGVRGAVSGGRNELSDELETPIIRFAYPHGHTNRDVADAVKAEGYTSAWTTERHVVFRDGDQMLGGRWDLGHRTLDAFRSTLVRGLARPRP